MRNAWGRRLLAAAALSAVVIGATGLSVMPAAATSGTVAPSGQVVLSRDVLRGLEQLPSRPAAADQVITVDLALATRDMAGVDASYRQIYDPASPAFHHFMSPAQVGERFGQPAPVYEGAAQWLRSGGLDVFNTVAMRDFIGASGTVAQVEKLFNVEIRDYSGPHGDFLANVAAPSVPANFAITTVIGLNTYQRFALPALHPGKPAQDLCQAGNCTGTTTPSDLWSVYEQPANVRGAGQSIAIIGEGVTPPTIASLAKFEDVFKLPHVPVKVVCAEPRVNGDCSSDTGGTGEWELDTQSSSSMAPDISGETLYFSHSLVDGSISNAFASWLNDPQGPLQANASFGECETGPANSTLNNPIFDPINVDKNPGAAAGTQLGDALEPAIEPMLKKGALQGKTLFASAGDTAGGCAALVVPVVGAGNGVVAQPVLEAPYPAAGAYVTGVGGTVLYTDGGTPPQRSQEYVWTHSGGGPSQYITAPAYQAGTPNQPFVCVSTPDGGTSNTGQLCRGVPDVAAQSGDVLTNGFAWYDNGALSSNGGTSLSSPLWAGMYARVQSAVNGRNGLANEFIYRVAKNPELYAQGFHDITTGANTDFPAIPSWDYASGWGTPRLTGLVVDAVNMSGAGTPSPAPGSPAITGGGLDLPPTSAVAPPGAVDPRVLVLLAGIMALAALVGTRRRS